MLQVEQALKGEGEQVEQASKGEGEEAEHALGGEGEQVEHALQGEGGQALEEQRVEDEQDEDIKRKQSPERLFSGAVCSCRVEKSRASRTSDTPGGFILGAFSSARLASSNPEWYHEGIYLGRIHTCASTTVS